MIISFVLRLYHFRARRRIKFVIYFSFLMHKWKWSHRWLRLRLCLCAVCVFSVIVLLLYFSFARDMVRLKSSVIELRHIAHSCNYVCMHYAACSVRCDSDGTWRTKKFKSFIQMKRRLIALLIRWRRRRLTRRQRQSNKTANAFTIHNERKCIWLSR